MLYNISLEETNEYNNYDIADGILLQLDTFIKPNVLLKKITSLFFFLVEMKKVFPKPLIKFVNKWIVERWEEDFSNNSELVREMKLFYIELTKFPESQQEEELKINYFLEILEQDIKEEAEFLINNFKKRKRSKNISNKNESLQPSILKDYFDVLDWPEMEIARQLSLYTHYFISQIEVKEILASRWTKKTKYIDSPNVMACIERFNKLILWVCEEVLSYDRSRIRAHVVEKFLKIAQCCRKLNNFNDCFNIISALNSLPLKYMSKMWRKLSSEGLKLLLELTNFISCENNYRGLREETSKAKGKPYIPYLALYLKELAYIEEGPKYLINGLVNVEKMRKVSSIIEEFFEFKLNAYLFKISSDLIFLSHPKTRTEDELIELSYKLGKFNII